MVSFNGKEKCGMTQKEIEKTFFILELKDMRCSLSTMILQQKHYSSPNDAINIAKLERLLGFLIEKETDELNKMKGEQKQ